MKTSPSTNRKTHPPPIPLALCPSRWGASSIERAMTAKPAPKNILIHVLTVAGSVAASFGTIAATVPQNTIPASWLAVGTGVATIVSGAVTALLGVLNP